MLKRVSMPEQVWLPKIDNVLEEAPLGEETASLEGAEPEDGSLSGLDA